MDIEHEMHRLAEAVIRVVALRRVLGLTPPGSPAPALREELERRLRFAQTQSERVGQALPPETIDSIRTRVLAMLPIQQES